MSSARPRQPRPHIISSTPAAANPPPTTNLGNPRSSNVVNPPSGSTTVKQPVLNTISLAVDNPLYDSLPVKPTSICDNQSLLSAPDDSIRGGSNRHIEGPPSPAASLISDSIAYCGRFPPLDRRLCPQCGELLDECPHSDMVDEISSVSSAGRSSSTAPSTTVSDQPLSFNTFQPRRSILQTDRCGSTDPLGSRLTEVLSPTGSCSTAASASKTATLGRTKKRLSAIELPTGETYLPIEQPLPGLRGDGRDPGEEAREYRGGGTLPRHGLQQEWLEASLNCSDTGFRDSKSSTLQRNKERGSRISLFRSSKREPKNSKEQQQGGARDTNSLGRKQRRRSLRRKSEGKQQSADQDPLAVAAAKLAAEHSDVASKSADMFS